MKKITVLLILVLIFSVTGNSWSLQATSSKEPERLTKSRGVTQYTYNIQEVNGAWEYNYVEIKGKVTAAKIKEAMRLEKNADQPFDLADVEAEYTNVEEKLAQIAQMGYAQIDTHVDNVFSNLSVAQRTSLKKLYKAMLALIKQLDLE